MHPAAGKDFKAAFVAQKINAGVLMSSGLDITPTLALEFFNFFLIFHLNLDMRFF